MAPATAEVTQRRGLMVAALLALVGIWYVVKPVALGIFLGALLAFLAQPLFARLRRKLSVNASALLTSLVVSLLVVASLAGLGWVLGSKGAVHAREMVDSATSDGGVLEKLQHVLARFGFHDVDPVVRIRGWMEDETARLATVGATVLGVTADALLMLFFMVMAMHFVLRNAPRLLTLATETLPLKPDWTLELFSDFRRVGRATLYGTLVTGLAQGVLATVSYFFAGVSDPLFYGAATAVASLVPAVGTLLVWVPVGVVLLLTGHVGAGVFVLAWGAAVVVGVSDYVIRPWLVGDEGLPSLLTFAAIFGGLEAFGLKGLIVGPVVLSLGFSVLRLYHRERTAPRVEVLPAGAPVITPGETGEAQSPAGSVVE